MSGQREGQRSQNYKVTFLSNDKSYVYPTSDLNVFSQCKPGSTWVLKVNTLGSLVSIEKK